MSDSPQSNPKEIEGAHTPDEEAQMNDPQDPQSAGLGYEFEVKEQDRWLPIANGSPEAPRASVSSKGDKQHHDAYDANIRNFAPVARIMKNALPDNAKIAKEAKECMQECVSEFISFITSEASEKCHQEKRKTVNGEDILFAMTSLGFENYSEALKIYLAKYREQNQSTRGEGQQNRPSSQGYGAPPGAAPGTNATAGFPGGELGQQGTEAPGDASGYLYSTQPGHNGATAGEY
ncbi:nuclear transcription factor Y subunit B-3 [Pyricularia oryzae]|nr:nuclear transcription factor Y subunit B-3 [Pyricularia oryzae]